MKSYDVIIVGGGLAGLECGAILSKEGHSVCVLEKNDLLGGCFQTFPRYGRKLDTGIHYIGSLDEGQLMHQIWKYLGIIDKIQLQRLEPTGFDHIHLDSGIYKIGMGYENFMGNMLQQFPKERATLQQYIATLQEVGNTSSVESLQRGTFSDGGMRYFYQSASAFIEETTDNKTLQRVLTGTAQLYGGVRDKSTLYSHAMVNNSYIQSSYRLVGGSMQVTDALVRVIEENGGTVRTNCNVTRIKTNGTKVTGIEVNGEEHIEGKQYICTIHPQVAIPLIEDTPAIKKIYRRRIADMPNSYGVFTLYLLMKDGAYPYERYNHYVYGKRDTWYNEAGEKGCLITSQATSVEQKYADVITILMTIPYDEVMQWEGTTVNHRGDEYLAYKERKTADILQFVASQGFDYADKVEHIVTSSPLTYRDYTGTAQGSAYGLAKDYHDPQRCFMPTRTRLENFYFAGQSINIHGALGVSLTSLLTCAEFLGEEYLAKKIGYA